MTNVQFIGVKIDCPICGHEEQGVVGEQDRKGHPLKTVLCKNCGHVFTNPQPTSTDLQAYYGERYRTAYKGVTTPKIKHVYRAGLRALERFDQIKTQLPTGARVLDIGSGGGEFVYLLSKAGFEVRGIEPNTGYADFSSNQYGIDIQKGGVEETLNDRSKYDAITLHHVLEHLAAPAAALQSISAALNPDGILVVEVPNVETPYHAPQRQFHFAHLHSFSIETLQLAGSRAGLHASQVMLQPHTQHISVRFTRKAEQNHALPDITVAKRIGSSLRSNTKARDLLSPRPYRKLWANLKRPVREHLALRNLGSPPDARSVLDRLYDRALDLAKH